MSLRFLISSLLILVCLAALWAVIAQRQELGHLRMSHQAQITALAQDTAAPAPSEVKPAEPAPGPAPEGSSSELLQLRSEVTRLTQQRQALAGVRTENERLRTQLASRGTNAPPGMAMPPGFIRKSQAQMVGYNSPQDTLQSLLWAFQNHDFNSLLQAYTPEAAQSMRARFQQPGPSIEALFHDADSVVGVALIEQKQLPDGSIEAKIQAGPGEVSPHRTIFRLVNGQWKVADPF